MEGRRPPDVLIPNWATGKDAVLTITVLNPLQKLNLGGGWGSTTPDHELTAVYSRKSVGALTRRHTWNKLQPYDLLGHVINRPGVAGAVL